MPARDPAETREVLVEAAIGSLRELTVAGLVTAVGTREIARRAGVSAATLFHHFGSVDGLAQAVLERIYDPTTSPVVAINAKVATVQQSDLPAQDGMQLHRSEFERLRSDRHHRLRIGLWAFGGDEARQRYGDYVRDSDGRLTAATTELFESWGREIRPPFDVSMFVAAQAALLTGSVVRWTIDPAAVDVERFAQTASALSLVMLRVPGDRLDLDDRLAEINYYPLRDPGGRTPSERRSRTRERVLQTAADLFARHGLEQATIAQVARAAHVSVNTVYGIAESKSDLAVALLMAEAEAAWPEASPPGPDPHSGPDPDLETALADVAAFVAARSAYAAPYVALLATGAPRPDPDPLQAHVDRVLAQGGTAPGTGDAVLLLLASTVLRAPAAGAAGALAVVAPLLDQTGVPSVERSISRRDLNTLATVTG